MSGVVALDNFDPKGSKYMRSLFPDVIEPGHASHDSWREHAVGLLVGNSYVTAEDINSSKKLRYIVRHGVGYEKVDVDACKAKGVIVCNVPGVSAVSVAEVALSMICACAKNLVELSTQIRNGEKLNKSFRSLYSAMVLTGKTFGIIGGGAIGRNVAKKLIGAFDAEIVMYDPYISIDGTGPWSTIPHKRAASIKEMLPIVDVVTLHLPLLPTTRNLITLPLLKTMKPTSILVNTSRGGIVNEDDLWTALRERIIASAGVDAWMSEPPTREAYGDILDLDNLVMSPHIGGSPAEVSEANCRSMCDHMKEMIDGKEARDRVA